MDRLSRVIAGGCLTLALGMVFTASGCRSMRNDVPRQALCDQGATRRRWASTRIPTRTPRWATGCISPVRPIRTETGSAADQPQYGTPTPNASPYGMPTADKYGPTGTAGRAPNQ